MTVGGPRPESVGKETLGNLIYRKPMEPTRSVHCFVVGNECDDDHDSVSEDGDTEVVGDPLSPLDL